VDQDRCAYMDDRKLRPDTLKNRLTGVIHGKEDITKFRRHRKRGGVKQKGRIADSPNPEMEGKKREGARRTKRLNLWDSRSLGKTVVGEAMY